jgi:hypothetical protein
MSSYAPLKYIFELCRSTLSCPSFFLRLNDHYIITTSYSQRKIAEWLFLPILSKGTLRIYNMVSF